MDILIKNITGRKISFVREPFSTFGTQAYSKMKKLCLNNPFNIYVGMYERLTGNTNNYHFFVCRYNKEKDLLQVDFTEDMPSIVYPYPTREQKEKETSLYMNNFKLEQMIQLLNKEEEEEI